MEKLVALEYYESGEQQVEEETDFVTCPFKQGKFDEKGDANSTEVNLEVTSHRNSEEENWETSVDRIRLDAQNEALWSANDSSSSRHPRPHSESDHFNFGMKLGADDDVDNETDPYDVLSTDQLVECMSSTLQETNSILQLPSITMRQLLNHFRWDKQLVLEAYYNVTDDDKGRDEFFKNAKVIEVNRTEHQFRALPSVNGGKVEQCQICCLERLPSSMFGLSCGHGFCTACWTEYLTSKILEGGTTQAITCAAHNCPVLVDDDDVMKLLTDPQMKVKYQQQTTNSFVQCNRYMKWCPSPGCVNAIKVKWEDGLSRSVTCSCRHTFCFKCGEIGHIPLDCGMFKKWLQKCEDVSETSNWMMTNTKKCPTCRVSIEKNEGCNHIFCIVCGTQFCWKCMELTTNHHHPCNVYKKPDWQTAKDNWGDEMGPYLFYFNRFKIHSRSLELEKKLYNKIGDLIPEIERTCGRVSWAELQILHKAVDVLCECRETLLSTYVFAYYAQKTNEKEIFEDNQHDLESATEKLSRYLETWMKSANLYYNKTKLQDMMNYCTRRRQVLIEHVREGHQKDFWKFNSD